jgi:hypothetical protein
VTIVTSANTQDETLVERLFAKRWGGNSVRCRRS